MKMTLPNIIGDVFTLDEESIQTGIRESRSSPRQRMILPLHRDQDDLVQRMLNFLQPGTYVVPHLHPRESASETIFVIRGSLGFLQLDENGGVLEKWRLGAGGLIDIVPSVWHTLIALEPDTVILEIKRGPYDDTDKVFADWAPPENTPGAADLLREYEGFFRGRC